MCKSVLILDPDPNVLALLTSVLEGADAQRNMKMRVLRARTVGEAVDVLQRNYVPVDLVLSNSGFGSDEVTRQLTEARPKVPVMFMSSISDDSTVRIQGPSSDQAGSPGVLRAVVAALDTPVVRAAGSR
jgi:CheY-like chemotaxis protein